MLKYSYYIARVSHFIASKMQSAVTKNMVFPSCTDIPLPPLLALDHRFAAAAIPAFLATGALTAWPDGCSQLVRSLHHMSRLPLSKKLMCRFAQLVLQ